MRNSGERVRRFLETHRQVVVVSALLLLAGILLACDHEDQSSKSQTSENETNIVVCQYFDDLKNESHSQSVLVPGDEAYLPGIGKLSVCYQNDEAFREKVDGLMADPTLGDHLSIGVVPFSNRESDKID